MTQPSLTQVTAASARTLAASGCRTTSRTIQASSLTSFDGQDDAERGAVDRGPPAGHRERVRVVELGQLLAGHDPAHSLVTSFVHAGENPGAAGGTSSSRPASICVAITPPARRTHRIGRRRGVLGGELFQFGRVPGHGLGQQAAEPHVVLGHLALAGVGDRDVRRAVLDGQDRRGVGVGAAVDVGAGGQPDVGLDRGRAVRAEPDCMPWRSCRHLLPAGQRHQVRPLRARRRAAPRLRAVSVYGTGTSGSGGRPRYRRSTATA